MDENGQIFKKYLKYLIFPKNGKIFFKYLNVFPSSNHQSSCLNMNKMRRPDIRYFL